MNKITLQIIKQMIAGCFILFPAINIVAVPADPTPFKVKQPDGNELTIQLHGDEFVHFYTTVDGYTVIKSVDGFYRYAVKDTIVGKLSAGQYVAKDIKERSVNEQRFLQTLNKYIYEVQSEQKVKRAQAKSDIQKNSLQKISSKQFRGVIILAQFADRPFFIANPQAVIDVTINQKNYKEDGFSGSVRDYYYDNSMGKFEPQFDVVGPVTLDYRQADALGADNGQALVRNACIKAEDLANFSDYDLNHDGEVDMVYVIFAGGGSHAGNNPDFIWPHAFALNNARVKLDGVYCNRYACSTELAGRENLPVRDGIGTICHEFSHVLGLPDFYDTDYEKNGTAPDPGEWSLMASGSYLNNGRTPCGYSAFERYAVGWSIPTLIERSGDYKLNPLHTSNEGFRINSAVDKEFFILENRQEEGWDRYLPGHGLLVFRVDSTNPTAWIQNTINNNPEHVYYELIRADNSTTDSGGNAFPGMNQREELTDETTPSMRSWTGTPTEMPISSIQEKNGIISFNISGIAYNNQIETFETIIKDNWIKESIKGVLGDWTFSNAITYPIEVANGMGSGQVVASIKNGKIEMEFDMNEDIKSVSLIAGKLSTSAMPKTIKIEVSKDKGSSWMAYGDNIILTEKKMNLYSINEGVTSPARFRIVGIGSSEALVDNFTIKSKQATSIEKLQKEKIKVYTSGGKVYVLGIYDEQVIEIYNISGQRIRNKSCSKGWNEFPLEEKGVYIIKINESTVKIIL